MELEDIFSEKYMTVTIIGALKTVTAIVIHIFTFLN